MRTTDLFNFNRSSKRLNESLEKTFGTKINFEAFDTPQLEDSRNKLRTQIHTARGQSGFNETIENETLTKAQFIHDAIVAELMNRQEHIVDTVVDEDEEQQDEAYDMDQLRKDAAAGVKASIDKQSDDRIAKLKHGEKDEPFMAQVGRKIIGGVKGAARGFAGKESIETESAPPTSKGERMVKHIKKGYADDGKLTDKEKSIAYATAWKAHNKNESIEQTGDDMRNLREGEIQQASAIVTAKTMVDRVGRWIEELSGMENETLLQLGDSIRDEMGQEQAKAFIEAVAPAIQAALDNLKTTRDTLSTGVRALASGEAPEGMLGAEPEMGMGDEAGMDMAEPDMMNEPEMGGEEEDAFAAAEPGAGGMETSGREQRESIDRQGRLMKILAG